MRCPKCHSENPDTARFCLDCGTQFGGSKMEASPPGVSATLQMPLRELSTGSTFAGRYQVIEELGHGGMGKVYKVFDAKVGEKIALKLIRPEITLDKETVDRFSNELKLARKIRHKNVCQMFDLGEEDGTHFITMEYVHGEDLKQLIRKVGRLSAGQAVLIANQVCEGLEEAHRLGIVHRDLKPQNIMIDEDGNARIMDFGIARSLKTRGITGAGVMIGTPEYMSPEQVEGKDIDQRSDIYSLGVILYEMVTGRVPFEGDTPFTIGVKHKSEIPKNPNEINTQIPDDLSQVILKCLEKNKEKRYQSAGELGAELSKIEGGIPTAEKAIPRRKPFTSKQITVQFSVKRLFVPALIFVGLVIAGLMIWKFIPRKVAPIVPKIANSIAVISFENQTGDKAYDYLQKAIPNLLITNLEQAGLPYVASWERLRDLLKQMGKGDVEIIDRDLGFELCRRDGIENVVLGSIVKAGDFFVTNINVLNAETKRSLKSAISRGKGVDSILETQIDQLGREITQGLGSLGKNAGLSPAKVADVTTNSMEAYNYYLRGIEDNDKLYYESAQKFFEKAVEKDPTFATAYFYLARMYWARGNSKAGLETAEKAKKFAGKATEKERLYMEAGYALRIEKNEEKYVRLLKQLSEKYPKDKVFHGDLGFYYQGRDSNKAIEEYNKALELDPNYSIIVNQLAMTYLGMKNYEKALEYLRRYATILPGDANPFDSMACVYFDMGNLEEAIAKFKEALEVRPDFDMSLISVQYIYALKQDYSEANKYLDQLISIVKSPGIKLTGYWYKGFYDFWLGRRADALSNLQKAEDMAAELGNEANKAFINCLRGWVYLDRGDLEPSRNYFKTWFDLLMKTDPANSSFYKAFGNLVLGLVDLKQGRIDQAKSRLAEINIKNNPYIVFYYNLLNAEILLQEGFPEKAISEFEKTPTIECPGLQYSNWTIIYNLPPLKDVVARAYQKKGDLDRAITEYEKLITFDPKSESRFLIHPLYYCRLAKLYEQKGLTTKAQDQFKKFLDLWKEADPGRPEVEDAKKRLSALKMSS